MLAVAARSGDFVPLSADVEEVGNAEDDDEECKEEKIVVEDAAAFVVLVGVGGV